MCTLFSLSLSLSSFPLTATTIFFFFFPFRRRSLTSSHHQHLPLLFSSFFSPLIVASGSLILFFLTRLIRPGCRFPRKSAGSLGFQPGHYKAESKDVTRPASWPIPGFFNRTGRTCPISTTMLICIWIASPCSILNYCIIHIFVST